MLAYDWSLGSLAGEWVECGFDYLFKEREYNSGRPLLINTYSAEDRISAAGDKVSFVLWSSHLISVFSFAKDFPFS
jgi:hypothetical protein